MRHLLGRIPGVLGLFVAAPLSLASGILIVQTTETRALEADENRILVQVLAEEFDQDGRVAPVAWSVNDGIFRSALANKVVTVADNPDLATAFAAAEKLREEYVLVVTVLKKDTDIAGRARLYRKGQLIWQDPESPAKPTEAGDATRIITVKTNGGADLANTLRAAARTWTQLIFSGPMKALAPRPRIETPAPSPGVKVDIPDVAPPRKVDNHELMAEVMKKLASNQVAEAIALLRDAVDAEPLDSERRKALANALATAGLHEDAASEAHRAAELFPDQPDLRTQAARFWMAAGKMDEAALDLNEAVARNPESVETRMLLGEIALGKLQVDGALSHFDFVISKTPTADAYFKRALARSMNDNLDGCKKDLDEAKRLGLGRDAFEVRTQYTTAIQVSQASLSEMSVAIRTLMQKARANFGSKEVRSDQKTLANRSAALIAVLGALTPPPAHKVSHGQRALALKLLDQCLSELGSYLDSGSEDTLGDATISLGEALKALTAADTAYKAESAKV